MDVSSIKENIKKSKKYGGINEEIIKREVEDFVKKNPRYTEHKENFILKQIKEKLHWAYGSFQTRKKSKIRKLLEQLRNKKSISIIREILNTNLSTKERLPLYGQIYEKIFEITGTPDSILDLGCGLNPISYPYMELDEDAKYYAYDINEDDLKIIREFLEIYAVNSDVQTIDLKNVKQIKKLPPADVCFMFKVLDPIEKREKGHKLAEEIMEILRKKYKFIVISFASQTLSGKKMNYPQRGWIERMLTRIGLKFESFETENEIFYVVKVME